MAALKRRFTAHHDHAVALINAATTDQSGRYREPTGCWRQCAYVELLSRGLESRMLLADIDPRTVREHRDD